MKKLMLISAVFLMSLSVNTQAEAPAKYNQFCIACHGTGAAGAPKTGDAAAWKTRMEGGIDALVVSSKKGKNAMPPMGLCNDCSDAEIKQIIEFMVK